MGEKSPSERKPNRFFRGAIIRAAITEALEYAQGLGRPLQSDTECSGDYDDVGIGAMDSAQLTIPDDQPEHWHNWGLDLDQKK